MQPKSLALLSSHYRMNCLVPKPPTLAVAMTVFFLPGIMTEMGQIETLLPVGLEVSAWTELHVHGHRVVIFLQSHFEITRSLGRCVDVYT